MLNDAIQGMLKAYCICGLAQFKSRGRAGTGSRRAWQYRPSEAATTIVVTSADLLEQVVTSPGQQADHQRSQGREKYDQAQEDRWTGECHSRVNPWQSLGRIVLSAVDLAGRSDLTGTVSSSGKR